METGRGYIDHAGEYDRTWRKWKYGSIGLMCVAIVTVIDIARSARRIARGK